MADELRAGDEVEWNTPQGVTHGAVVRKLTSPATIDGHEAKASEDEPQYLVRSATTGAEAAHHPDALRRR